MELANILELIHAVSDSDLTEFNLQDDTLNISMSKEKTIVQQMAVNTDPADAHRAPACPPGSQLPHLRIQSGCFR